MCFAPIADRVFVPVYQPQAPVIHVSNSSESKVYKAICHFFLACTAVAGVAFLATGSGGALATALVLGTIAFCLYFPDSLSSGSYHTHRTTRSYFEPSPPARQRETIIVQHQQPAPVFVDRGPRERRHNRNQFEIPVDAFVPDRRRNVVVPAEQIFERHPVGNQQVAQPPRRQDAVIDLQERHAVGGRQANLQQPPNGPIDPFERHQVGQG